MTDEQQRAMAELAEQLRRLAKVADGLSKAAAGEVVGPLECQDHPGMGTAFCDLVDIGITTGTANVTRALAELRAALDPGELRLVDDD